MMPTKMPFCEVASPQNATTDAKLNAGIFYRTYGRGPTKVLLIIGLAGTHDSWGPQIHSMTGTVILNDGQSAAAADCFDNKAGF
ncbi:hypothetical protein ACFX14_022004 [Malus domestica]